MKIKTAWAIRSLGLCVLFNLAFTALVFHMASGVINGSQQWVSALGASLKPAMPADIHMAFGGLSAIIARSRAWLPVALAVPASAFTLLMWFCIFLTGSKQMERSMAVSMGSAAETQPLDAGPPGAGDADAGAGAGERSVENG